MMDKLIKLLLFLGTAWHYKHVLVGVRLDDVDSSGSRVCSINSMQQPFCISLLMVSLEVQLYTISVRVVLQGLLQDAIRCNPPSN